MFVTHDPLGNPVDRRHPWNQHTNPQPQKRDFDDKYSWVMSPRWFDGKDYLALDTGGGPLARLWSTALAGLVDIGYVKATGSSVQINLPKTALKGPVELRVEDPAVEQHHRAQPGPHLLPGLRRRLRAALRREGAGRDPGRPHQDLGDRSRCPTRASAAASPRPSAACCRHHMVIRDGKIANYHPYPPTPWNASPRDSYGTPGPVRGRRPGAADLRGERPGALQGHRHHAHGPQLRPVPAVRRAHVPRRRARRWSCCTRPPSRSPASDGRR